MDKIWGGNTYKNVNADTKPVYSGSSSGGHIVTQPNTSSGSGSSRGSKKKKKVAAPTATTQAATVKVASARRGGGGGGGEAAAAGSDYADVLKKYLNKLKKISKNLYNQNMEGIDTGYGDAENNLRANYHSLQEQLQGQFDYQKGLVDDDANEGMRQAYINYMLNKKDLGQKMASLGLSGGATETTLASMGNNFANNRNNIDTARQKSLAELNQTYQGNLADALRTYNSSLSDLYLQRLQAEQAARSAYLQNLASYTSFM